MIEMTVPSSLDDSLAPEGHHVCLFFTQYTPYDLEWNDVSWQQNSMGDSRKWQLVSPSIALKEVTYAAAWASDGRGSKFKNKHVSSTTTNS